MEVSLSAAVAVAPDLLEARKTLVAISRRNVYRIMFLVYI